MKTVRFNDALEIARGLLSKSELIRAKEPKNFVLLRDLYGRLRLLCPVLTPAEQEELKAAWIGALGSSTDSERPILLNSDFFNAEKV